ncbi:MAG: DUF1330 domain-containing protein [Caulobacterales bacterium]|uniref:DUF1330 domain-containing protein n=1 Tax=Glycocaulis sp. TaxID=1969725 RepID=UPI003FA1660D
MSLKIVITAIVCSLSGLGAGLALSGAISPDQPAASAQSLEPAAAPPPAGAAYMVVMGTVHDRANFGANYVAHLPPLYARHGGQYLAVTGNLETLEGELGFRSVVLSVWPDAQSARDFWNDPEYRALAEARIEGGWGDFDVMLLEGLPGVVPVLASEAASED